MNHTENWRGTTRRRDRDMVFTPADPDAPPLLTVVIEDATDSPGKQEAIPMTGSDDVADNATIRARIAAGEDLQAISSALHVPFNRVRAIKAALARGKKPADSPAAKEEAVVHRPMGALDWVPLGRSGEATGVAREEETPLESPPETLAQKPFRIVLDPGTVQHAFTEAAQAWIAEHFTTTFDGHIIAAQCPPLPTRWVMYATVTQITAEEESET